MKKSIKAAVAALVALAIVAGFAGCASAKTLQYGEEGMNTIALNLTRDPNVGVVYVTHVNGMATGAEYKSGFMGFGKKSVFVNPIYVELNGRPIIFTIMCPVVVGRNKYGNSIIQYRSTELRLTQLADLKPGDVVTLRWMYQTQTFAFLDATGNIVQQTIPSFN